ncbi:hypothetical protein EI77_04472 [Prosthecobacter fusiformis]|uniref:Glycosyl hydrolase-like 10 domain-containing protein n=1 Tax=Prosthecobacter fusiformis TaxID=48464 RepID=A0A4R7RIR9_9BACT|nr:hypothetical protein [Prosthecobacter fusiformis]TDU63151.1 hypothetical protein EI77_04472 [Prosthecobacter fusiformis]
MMNRRQFLQTTTATALLASRPILPAAQGMRPKPAFRVLYSNDTTNILTSPRPGYVRKDPFSLERLAASVDEAAEVDVHLLQPGNGWVPWWKSSVYPADAHYRWFQEKTGLPAGSIGELMLKGSDLVGSFINHCRARKVSPFISIRLNDYHGIEMLEMVKRRMYRNEQNTPKPKIDHELVAWLSRPLYEHLEYRLRPDPDNYARLSEAEEVKYVNSMRSRNQLRTGRVWNWAIPEVPAYKLSLIRELCENYDFAGLELDFMRWSAFFRLEETTEEQRVAIMVSFIKQVREALDSNTPSKQKRWLCVRVPLRLSGHSPLGVDLPQWVAAGVDMVNLSCHYTTEQQTDLPHICRLIPETPVYLEMSFTSSRYPKPTTDKPGTSGANSDVYRKMTLEQFCTTAHLVNKRGGAGVSLFNFVYYRSLADLKTEPPFDVLARLKDRDWLSRQPQHYFLSNATNPPSEASQFARNRVVSAGKERLFLMDTAPPASGWKTDGRLRIQSLQPMEQRQLEVRFNGFELIPTNEISEPYPQPYADGLGNVETLRAWIVPNQAMRDGPNEIKVGFSDGAPLEIVFMDLDIQ